MKIHFFPTRQIFQSELRVKGNRSGFTFYNRFGNAVLLATLNL